MVTIAARALAAFLPVDLLFRGLIWTGYLSMLGPLEPGVGSRLGRLAVAVAAPAVVGWMLVLRAMLRPIGRGPEGPEVAVRLAIRAAALAPHRFALVWGASWVLPALVLNTLVLEVWPGSFGLPRYTWIGVGMMLACFVCGALSLSYLFLSWLLAPVSGALSVAARAHGIATSEPGLSLRARTAGVALCLGLAPLLWLGSVSYMTTARHAPEVAAHHLAVILFFSAVAALYALLAAGFFARSIGVPVASMAKVIREITAQGDVTDIRRIPVFQRDEIGGLVEGTNRMLDRLEQAARASQAAQASLREANESLERRVLERTAALEQTNRVLEKSLSELRAAQRDLFDASRRAGMAEVATAVLHNVGNVMNSVNISAQTVSDLVRESSAAQVTMVAGLLEQRRDDLARFLTTDERGRRLPEYVHALAEAIASEQATALKELTSLREHIAHINAVVSRQQSLARGLLSATETMDLEAVIEDALRIGAIADARVSVVRQVEPVAVVADRHIVLQILINLLRNAREAVQAAGSAVITVRARKQDPDRVVVQVIDEGCGFAAEDLSKLFSHGFTTKRSGHGFGLHSSICAARAMGGDLTASSAGPGRGATFSLLLPVRPPAHIAASAAAPAPARSVA
jgi:signal transduction histidine kinase